jgi:uncharacterized membrane protein required for colicin V production
MSNLDIIILIITAAMGLAGWVKGFRYTLIHWGSWLVAFGVTYAIATYMPKILRTWSQNIMGWLHKVAPQTQEWTAIQNMLPLLIIFVLVFVAYRLIMTMGLFSLPLINKPLGLVIGLLSGMLINIIMIIMLSYQAHPPVRQAVKNSTIAQIVITYHQKWYNKLYNQVKK